MKKLFSQEHLKILACFTMLVDHVGAVFFPQYRLLRVIGRIAFPIYAFLLVQGAEHTLDPKGYALRLAAGMLLSELSFDYLFYGRITWAHQSVMVTLLIGYGMLVWMKRMKDWGKVLPLALCFSVAEFCATDYGGWGIAVIWIFAAIRDRKLRWLIRFILLALTFWLMDSFTVSLGPVSVPVQMFALLALIPISLYSGKKITDNKWVRWGFYLFYPVHLTILLAIAVIIP